MRAGNYPVGDFLIRVKNAALARKRSLSVGESNLIKGVAEALKREGFLDEVKSKDGNVEIRISYRKKEPLLMTLKLVSKPGLRIYMSADDLENKKGPETYIVSTPKGVLTSKEAVEKRVGGEVIAEVL